ncbi:MAG: T9SS type A sorting domain-containing protein [Flavobacteriales bacterium]|nr:T9SS type A sorting domain-containing protein [Flavobacteriales bacterium]MCB9166107.1 T9SS type A sorting domain-containing protein [Flavobacteriales bacterium]
MRIEPLYLLLIALGLPVAITAQSDALFPLHADPRPAPAGVLQRSGMGLEHFTYRFDTQSLPIIDDFSIDRTLHPDAQASDPDVTLDSLVFHLAVAGVSTPDQAFRTDTTHHIVRDTTDPDTTIVTVEPNPSTLVTVFDLSAWPPTSMEVTGWPPYDLVDTIGDPTTDTLALAPDLTQDTLRAYHVDADPRTYLLANGTSTPLVLWADDDVYINGTYPVDPPTIGVATFDGLDRTGYPYRDDQPTAWGIADHLTSVPIDLALQPGDSVYLSFFYQPQGLSGDDQVQEQDSLVLEFYAPDDDEWVRVWRTPYEALAPFEQVLVPITDTRFLKPDFRMRFLNYATLSGALDQWHIDYVRLNQNRNHQDTLLVDIAYQYPESSLLDVYSAMPYTHYGLSPSSSMAATVSASIRNLDDVDHFITWRMQAGDRGAPPTYDPNYFGINSSNNAGSTFDSGYPENSFQSDFQYASGSVDGYGFSTVKLICNSTPDINRYNDTITFTQELSNYYAYDDGSAEAGYGLVNATGGKIAVRFDLQTGDSLRAVRIYFDPIFYPSDPSTTSFLLTVWSSLDPEVVQMQNFSFSSPQYVQWGLNKFVEYPLDSTIWVQGTIYVGITQTGSQNLQMGFDRNRDRHERIFYKVGTGFVNTGYAGSLMLRPVFVAQADPWAGVPDGDQGDKPLVLWPNPTDGLLWIDPSMGDTPGARIRLTDATGRTVLDGPLQRDVPIDLGGHAPGLYLVRVNAQDGSLLAQGRVLVLR